MNPVVYGSRKKNIIPEIHPCPNEFAVIITPIEAWINRTNTVVANGNKIIFSGFALVNNPAITAPVAAAIVTNIPADPNMNVKRLASLVVIDNISPLDPNTNPKTENMASVPVESPASFNKKINPTLVTTYFHILTIRT
ncbi:hypothetical protein LCGC14_0571300 [marine sediment metagenome]|uniref:Uncharacterized protein n=1 Tax=marine sediment metagenome TaxID=412755 RepID=A0A0F9S2T8_9ZZZZ